MSSESASIFSFIICIPFISFSCLIVLARMSSAMLNIGRESRHLYVTGLGTKYPVLHHEIRC